MPKGGLADHRSILFAAAIEELAETYGIDLKSIVIANKDDKMNAPLEN